MTAKEEIFREDTLLLHIAVSNNQIIFEIFVNHIQCNNENDELLQWVPKNFPFYHSRLLGCNISTEKLKWTASKWKTLISAAREFELSTQNRL